MIVRYKNLYEHKQKSVGTRKHKTAKQQNTNTKAMIMIYMGPVWAKMQPWPVRSLSLWTIQMSGSVEIENMETLLARAKTSLPTKPRDIKNEVSGWMASGISRFLPQENKKSARTLKICASKTIPWKCWSALKSAQNQEWGLVYLHWPH